MPGLNTYIAKHTQIFARQLGLKPCFTPVRSLQSNGILQAFVKTLKRDYVHVTPLAGCLDRSRFDWKLDRGLQRKPSALQG